MTSMQEPGVPQPLLEILANENTRQVLLKISYDGPTRWSAVRDDLGMHPQAYTRAIEELEELGLIRDRAPGNPKEDRKTRRQVRLLETTKRGTFLVELWEHINKDAMRLAKARRISFDNLVSDDLVEETEAQG